MKKIIFLGSFLLLITSTLIAAETYPSDEKHRGLIASGKYRIFPEGRAGNSLYLDNKKLISFSDRIIVEASQISKLKVLVYLYRDNNSKLFLDVFSYSSDVTAKIKAVDEEFYEILIPEKGTRKIYRIYQGKISTIFDHSRTATGIAPSKKLVAFYHIWNSEMIKNENENYRVYEFRLHILVRSSNRIYTLKNISIIDRYPHLQLAWKNSSLLSYKTSNSDKKLVDIKEVLPQLF